LPERFHLLWQGRHVGQDGFMMASVEWMMIYAIELET
jgi:hypothetical protein